MCSWRSLPARADPVLPYLYVGNWTSGEKPEFLAENRISYVLNLTPDAHKKNGYPPTGGNRKLVRCQFAIRDTLSADISGYFQAANIFIERARKDESRVLIHCHMGVSRSCAIAIAHIMLADNIDRSGGKVGERHNLRQAWDFVKSRTTRCLPNVTFFRQLQGLERELFGVENCSMSLEEYDSEIVEFSESRNI